MSSRQNGKVFPVQKYSRPSRAKNALAVLLTFAQRCCSLNPPQAAVATLPDCINKAISIMIQSGYNSVELLQYFFTTIIFNFKFSILNYFIILPNRMQENDSQIPKTCINLV